MKPGPNGSFEFTNLPAGPVDLGISLDRIGMVTFDRRIQVQAGRTDVVYDVDLGLPLFIEIENWPKGQREYMRYVTLVPASGMPENPSLVARARLGTKIRFEGLAADETYSFSILGMDIQINGFRGISLRAGWKSQDIRQPSGHPYPFALVLPVPPVQSNAIGSCLKLLRGGF